MTSLFYSNFEQCTHLQMRTLKSVEELFIVSRADSCQNCKGSLFERIPQIPFVGFLFQTGRMRWLYCSFPPGILCLSNFEVVNVQRHSICWNRVWWSTSGLILFFCYEVWFEHWLWNLYWWIREVIPCFVCQKISLWLLRFKIDILACGHLLTTIQFPNWSAGIFSLWTTVSYKLDLEAFARPQGFSNGKAASAACRISRNGFSVVKICIELYRNWKTIHTIR